MHGDDLVKLVKDLKDLIHTRERVLGGGQAKDFGHYKQMVGEITGLSLAINEINSLQQRINRRNDDQDGNSGKKSSSRK